MKRKLFSLLLALVFVFSFSALAPAEELTDAPNVMEDAEDAAPAEAGGTAPSDLPLDFVTDDAFLLSDDALYDLNDRAGKLSEEYQFGVYIINILNYTHLEFSDGDPADITECANKIYAEYDLGYGESKDGILLLLSQEQQEYIVMEYGSVDFSDQNKSLLVDSFLPAFSNEDWYSGFRGYLEALTQVLPAALDGVDLDEVELHPDIEAEEPEEEKDQADSAPAGDKKEASAQKENTPWWVIAIIAAVLVLVIVIVCLCLKKKKAAKAAAQAAAAKAKKSKKK